MFETEHNPEPATKRKGRIRKLQAVIGIAVLVIFIGAAGYLTSDAFHNRVREKVVSELELVTGGRVQMGQLVWNLSKLEFETRSVTIHGLEGPNEVPYAHIDRLVVHAKLISLPAREIGLRYVLIEGPLIHLIAYPDGTTNQPVPKIKQQSNRTPVERLFDLAINRMELRNGALIYNQRRILLDFTADDLSAGMTYAIFDKRYDGSIHLGKLDTKLQNLRPVSSTAELQFSMWSTAMQLKSLKWSSGRSSFEASGRMDDFNHPKVQLAYNSTFDLAEVAAIARRPQLRAGHLSVNGSGVYSGATFSSLGKLLIRDVAYRDASLHLAGLDAGTEFFVDQDRVALSSLFARIFGGTVTGDVEIRNWSASSSSSPSTASRKPAQQQGTAHLRLANIPVATVAAAISTKSLPLEKIKPVGTAAGTVNASWKGMPSNAEAAILLNVAPPATLTPDELPLTARLQAVYRGMRQSLDVATLNLATRATRLNATGALGTAAANLKVSLNTTNLGEFRPALEAFRQPSSRGTQLPVDLSGRASFNGTVSGRLKAPAVAGRIEVADFTTLLPAAAAQGAKVTPPSSTVPQRQTRIHWDLLAADVEYSPRQAAARNGVLRRGPAQIRFDASAGLQNGSFTDSSQFNLRADVRNADIAELQSLAGYEYPVSGSLDLSLHAAGTKTDPRGEGTLQVSKAVAYGQTLKSVRTDLQFANHEARLNNIALSQNGARVNGTAAYNLKTKGYRFDLQGTNFDLAHIQFPQPQRFVVAGSLDFAAKGSGSVAEPALNADVRLRNVVMNGERVGDLDAHAVTQGADLRLNARSNFQNADLAMDGNVRLRGDFPANLSLRFSHLDMDPLIRAYMSGRITGHSSIAGDVQLAGPLRRARDLTIVGNIGQFQMEVENLRIQSDGPVRFRMEKQVAKLEQLRLIGEGTDITATGTVQLADTRAMDIRSDGDINLKLLQSFNPDLLAYGITTLTLHVGGDMTRPAVQGQVQIAGAGISFIDLPNGLSNINGVMVFNADRLQVQSLTAQTGGGQLRVGGFITYSRGISFNLTARGHDVRLRYPPGVSAMANANLQLAGGLKGSTLSGDVTVTKFGLNPRFDFALYLARSKQPPQTPQPNSPLNNLRLDVHIVSTPELQVETSLAKVTGDADLRLKGTGTNPVVLGRVNIVEGDMFFNGTKYHLERGDILFSNPVRIEPIVNIEASARVRDYDITLGFHGPVDKLSTSYRSDPPLPSGDIIALLALGRTREEQAAAQQQSTQNMTETASNAILGQALNAAVSSRVQKLFGVSRIKIDPQVGGPENNANARLTIEQSVSNKVTLTYITNLAQSAQQIIQIEYNVNRNVSVVAVRDQNGVVGFDVKIRQRKK